MNIHPLKITVKVYISETAEGYTINKFYLLFSCVIRLESLELTYDVWIAAWLEVTQIEYLFLSFYLTSGKKKNL